MLMKMIRSRCPGNAPYDRRKAVAHTSSSFRQCITKACQTLVLTFGVVVGPAVHAGIYEDFFLAVKRDRPAAVERILARGFDVNSPDPEGQLALHLALRDDLHQVAMVLLDAPGVDIDAPNAQGETPLMIAAIRGSLEWCQRLVHIGAKVNRSGWAPLHYAASSPDPRTIGFLLDEGAWIDAPGPNGTTALMMAAGYGSQEAVGLLLARGANPTLRNHLGLSARDFARRSGRDWLVRLLPDDR